MPYSSSSWRDFARFKGKEYSWAYRQLTIACLGNIGPGLHAVGPTANFAFFSSWQKLLMVVLMWLGRLEVYAIAAVVSAVFWRR
ncbi:MAG: hypothetical protein V3T72_18890 [Thermoanaerobaculia bacterium]